MKASTGISQENIERFAKLLLASVRSRYETEEGRRALEEWRNRKQKLKNQKKQ